jgi:hypothetical protein
MRELWGAFAVALVACGGAAARQTPEEGRGTAACRQWQDSVCDWATRCQALDREDCDAQFQGVTCRSDEAAAKCASAFDKSGCDRTPSRCGLSEIADPTPAERACDELTETFCRRSVECGISATEDDCLDREEVDCSRSVAYRLEYESCLDQIEEIECQIVRLPQICEAVIISSP